MLIAKGHIIIMLIHISSILSDTEHIFQPFCPSSVIFLYTSIVSFFGGRRGGQESMEVIKFLNNVFDLHDYEYLLNTNTC